MHDQDKDQFIDELFEASLKSYRSEEPRAGLENRILTHVSASERAARRWTWAWAFAAGAAVVVIATGAIIVSRRQPVPIPSPKEVAITKPAPASAVPPESSAPPKPRPDTAKLPVTRARDIMRGEPRPAQFPTPAPLNEQEERLLASLRHGPSPQLAADREKPQIEPLTIPELRIITLEIKPLPLNTNGKHD